MRLEQVEFFGIYWPPFLAEVAIAAIIFTVLHLVLMRMRFQRFVWHPALFELALFTCLLGAVMFLIAP